MTNAMAQKIQMLEDYISEATAIEGSQNAADAKRFSDTIIGVYDAEIPGLKESLDRFRWKAGDERTDYLFDVSLLRAKLQNYKLNLKSGLYGKLFSKTEGNVTVTQNTHQVMDNTVTVSLDQTIKQINELSDDKLSSEDKIALAEKLASIYASKDKKTKWEKAAGVLKWIAEKGIEVGVASLPYIMQSLQ